ncbi:MAG: hypothetical protein CW742_12670 [Methanoregula sp.]|nr:MAG: hypothetical protein CW742_12670 [Methanoregula sp.]
MPCTVFKLDPHPDEPGWGIFLGKNRIETATGAHLIGGDGRHGNEHAKVLEMAADDNFMRKSGGGDPPNPGCKKKPE